MMNKQGFTLIELSIVIVIIGLIIGGILVGRDLIRAAEIRAQISQIEEFNTAANTFRLKYNCLPGDCLNAQESGLGQTGGPGENGDGNGSLFESVDSIRTKEMINFWYHLAQAGLIAENAKGYTDGVVPATPGIDTPALKLTGTTIKNSASATSNPKGGVLVIALSRNGGHSWYLASDTSWTGIQTVYQGQTLYAIDSKIDDGYPRSGNMTSLGNRLSAAYDWFESMGYARCMVHTVDPIEYNLAPQFQSYSGFIVATQNSCSALIQSNF
ncbi:MAG: prepilin-type N-terminal cleavage/methylation domain-containing protein [Rickettsiales bacterium]|jgi:prepilin-type N-terminal cleavage/methylation domain-containing protein|nr:prepilin-type N-terminal cleavage/methylation domain-containing protein [Rickettsiales bacterium]